MEMRQLFASELENAMMQNENIVLLNADRNRILRTYIGRIQKSIFEN